MQLLEIKSLFNQKVNHTSKQQNVLKFDFKTGLYVTYTFSNLVMHLYYLIYPNGINLTNLQHKHFSTCILLLKHWTIKRTLTCFSSRVSIIQIVSYLSEFNFGILENSGPVDNLLGVWIWSSLG